MTIHEITLSVIITCYNYERYVSQAINSVISQDFKDLEIIIVDDGSVDGSWTKIQSYATHYPDRIKAIRHENIGALRSSLAGFALASGAFVCFLDADDYLQPGALGVIADSLTTQTSKIQFMLTPVDERGHPIGQPFPMLNTAETSQSLIESITERGHYTTPPTSGNIYRRDVYSTVQAEYDQLGYERAIDGIAFLLAPFFGQVVSIDEPLGCYRVHNANLSSFGTVSAERMDGYASRFLNRLTHLNRILARRSLKPISGIAREDHSYVHEMRMMAKIAAGERVRWDALRSHLKAARREYRGRRLLFVAGFGVVLFMLPSRFARKLVAVRMSQGESRKIRSWLKMLLTSPYHLSLKLLSVLCPSLLIL